MCTVSRSLQCLGHTAGSDDVAPANPCLLPHPGKEAVSKVLSHEIRLSTQQLTCCLPADGQVAASKWSHRVASLPPSDRNCPRREQPGRMSGFTQQMHGRESSDLLGGSPRPRLETAYLGPHCLCPDSPSPALPCHSPLRSMASQSWCTWVLVGPVNRVICPSSRNFFFFLPFLACPVNVLTH